MFAFDIDVNNTISNLAIEGNIAAKATADCVYIVHSKLDHNFTLNTAMHVPYDYIHGLLLLSGEKKLPITVLITTTLITILLIITVLAVIVAFVIRQHNKKSNTYLLSGCV